MKILLREGAYVENISIYFSGTGNSLDLAETIAEKIGADQFQSHKL